MKIFNERYIIYTKLVKNPQKKDNILTIKYFNRFDSL